jgi:pimeloyl-ACP methyl ester carboxylesterase
MKPDHCLPARPPRATSIGAMPGAALRPRRSSYDLFAADTAAIDDSDIPMKGKSMSRFRTFATLGLLFVSQAALAQPFTVVQVTEQRAQGIDRIEYVVQNGDDPMNRFGVERVVLTGLAEGGPTIPVILQPPLSSSAKFYTLGGHHHGSEFSHSIAATLARGGLDLYIYSPRETFLVPGQCANQADCAAAADWGIEAVLDDLAFTRDLIAAAHPGVRPIIGGYSLGGMVAVAAVNEAPDAYAGLILGDSTLRIEDPDPGFAILCQGISAAIAGGQVLDDQLGPIVQLIVQLALTAPDAPSPLPFFPPGTTNRQAYILFLSTPQPGPPASFFPAGAVLLPGSVEEDRLFNASESRVNAQLGAFNFYASNASMRDIVCGFAGDAAFVGNLASYTGPILSFEAGLGLGPYMNGTIHLTGSSKVRTESYPSFGHNDLPTSPSRKQLFDMKILEWIETDVAF